MSGVQVAVAAFMGGEPGDFVGLARAALRAQRAASPVLDAIYGPGDPTTVSEVPAVPVSLFKELDLGPQPPLPGDVVFRTSGTTGQVRGVHRSRNTTLYDLGAPRHLAACVGRWPDTIFSLCPTDADSSLGHMVGALGRVTATFGSAGVAGDAWETLARLAHAGPVFVAATAFALDAFFAQGGRVGLGPDSLVMVTGGFKGRHTRLDAPGLYRALPDHLGAPRVVGEYGMTELGSQLWTDLVPAGAVPGTFRAPRWLRVYTVDPTTGQPVAGEGVLRFVDLANTGSVLAVETQDLGVVVAAADGDRVTLRGRLEGAELRGCSLRAERARERAG